MADPSSAEHAAVPAFPQLHLEYWPTQMFYLLLALLALYFILTRNALPKVQATLEERRDTISGDLDKAAEFNLAAEEAEEAYHTALQNARAEAQKIADKTKADIKERLDVAVAEADKRIEAQTAESQKRLEALKQEAAIKAQEVATATAVALAQRFSPAPISDAEIQSAVSNRLTSSFGG